MGCVLPAWHSESYLLLGMRVQLSFASQLAAALVAVTGAGVTCIHICSQTCTLSSAHAAVAGAGQRPRGCIVCRRCALWQQRSALLPAKLLATAAAAATLLPQLLLLRRSRQRIPLAHAAVGPDAVSKVLRVLLQGVATTRSHSAFADAVHWLTKLCQTVSCMQPAPLAAPSVLPRAASRR